MAGPGFKSIIPGTMPSHRQLGVTLLMASGDGSDRLLSLVVRSMLGPGEGEEARTQMPTFSPEN